MMSAHHFEGHTERYNTLNMAYELFVHNNNGNTSAYQLTSIETMVNNNNELRSQCVSTYAPIIIVNRLLD